MRPEPGPVHAVWRAPASAHHTDALAEVDRAGDIGLITEIARDWFRAWFVAVPWLIGEAFRLAWQWWHERK